MNNIICYILTALLPILGYCSTQRYTQTNSDNVEEKIFWPRKPKQWLFVVFEFVVLLAMQISTHYTQYNNSIFALLMTILVGFAIPIAFIDAKTQTIPNVLLFVLFICRLCLYGWQLLTEFDQGWASLKDGLLAVLIFGGFFLLLAFVFKGSIGGGDVKLFAVIGFSLGIWDSVSVIFFSLLTCFVVCVVLLATKRKSRKDVIPFGPNFLMGMLIFYFFTIFK